MPHQLFNDSAGNVFQEGVLEAGGEGGSRMGRKWPYTCREVTKEWSTAKALCCENGGAQEDSFQ